MKSNHFTVNDIIEWFGCDHDTGNVFWKKKPNRNTPIGKKAGFLWKGSLSDQNTYIRICFKGKYILAHTIVFVCLYGRFPSGEIDHINGVGTDNRPTNIRDVSHSVNMRNQRLNAKNKSGFMGIDFHKASNKWRARIIVDKKEHHLGTYNNRGEAIQARSEAEKIFGFSENHGKARGD